MRKSNIKPSSNLFLQIKIWILIMVFCQLAFTNAQAQIEMPQLNSYMFNHMVYNPAAGGMYDTDFNANATSRIQWAGVDGAPLTNYAWADHRFRKNSMSAGLVLAYDRYGSRNFTDVAGNFTYVVRLNNNLKLGMGLRAGYTSFQFNASGSKIWDGSDPLAMPYTMNFPKFGTGLQLYNRKFYIGLSAPDIVNLNNSQFAADKEQSFFKKYRSYLFTAGYKVKLSDGFGLYPNAKIYYFSGLDVPVRVDAACLFEITDYFWAGANYATTGSVAAMAGTYISSRIRFMYAYEFATKAAPVGSVTFSVHEVSLLLQLDDLFARKNKSNIAE